MNRTYPAPAAGNPCAYPYPPMRQRTAACRRLVLYKEALLPDCGWGGLYPSRPASYSKGSRNGRQPRVYLTYLLLFLKKLRICEHILNCDANVYFANSTALVSRITLTFIWPGYSSSVSMRLTISFAMMIVSASLTFSGLTSIRISRPA